MAGKYFIVCDGMGQRNLGPADFASQLAAKKIGEVLSGIPISATNAIVIEGMVHGFENARDTIGRAQAFLNPGKNLFDDMGTTACAVFLYRDDSGKKRLVIGNVGDSRVYIFRKNKLRQVTIDKTMLDDNLKTKAKRRKCQEIFNEVEKAEDIKTEDLEKYTFFKRVCTARVLNGADYSDPRMEIFIEDVKPGDIFMVYSDGVSDCLTTRKAECVFQENKGIEYTGNKLMRLTCQRGQGDFLFKIDDRFLILGEIR